MKFRVLGYSAMTRREILKSVAKWVLYALVLMLSYAIEMTMPFASWQPYLTLTVAVAVSFFENELSGVIFAAFAGMMHDLAMGALFGFTSIWLMPCCLFVTLFVVNLIHRNLLNFLWMNLSVLVIVEAAELFFKYVIWRNPNINVVLLDYVLPAMISTVLLSAPIYLLIRLINRKLGAENTTENILTAFEDAEDDDNDAGF